MDRDHKQETEKRKKRFYQFAGMIGSFGAGRFAAAEPDYLTVAGIAVHTRASLEKLRAADKHLQVNVAGIFRLAGDVAPELACNVIQSLTIRGSFQASPEVKESLKDRIR